MNEIKNYKEKYHLNAEDFAKLVGLSTISIHKLEAHPENLVRCQTDTVLKISKVIGMKIEDLIYSCTGIKI